MIVWNGILMWILVKYLDAFQVVSEDELPASKKDVKESRKRKPDEERDGYDPGSPTSESESSNKKQAIAKVILNHTWNNVLMKMKTHVLISY